jgi:hypothetical protein
LWAPMEWNVITKHWEQTPYEMPAMDVPKDLRTIGRVTMSGDSSFQQGFLNFQNVAISVNSAGAVTLHTFVTTVASVPEMAIRHSPSPMRPADCDIYLRGTSYVLDMGRNAGMFWHFLTEQLYGIQSLLNEELLANPAEVHFFTRKMDPRGDFFTLYQWLNVHTLNCWQHLQSLPHQGRVCFDRLLVQKDETVPPGKTQLTKWAQHAVDRTGLGQAWTQGIAPVAGNTAAAEFDDQLTKQAQAGTRAVTVGFVSRMDKRIVLNEPALARSLSALSLSSLRIHYEGLPVHLQLAATRASDLLVGIHGSGLLNTLFMRRGNTTAEVQIVPPGLWTDERFVTCYKRTASQVQVQYHQLDLREEQCGVKHWHFAGDECNTEQYRQKLADKGTRALSPEMVRVLFIQQDAVVPVETFIQQIQPIVQSLRQNQARSNTKPDGQDTQRTS